MACVGCQKRREQIARLTASVGTIVFGRKRRLADFSEAAATETAKESGEHLRRGNVPPEARPRQRGPFLWR
jgi:hypothetical protein